MENCLVTKLKASVNNPNLPVLELMQQFTLEAITASGNNTMTDEQKYALNHFFIKIGAIDNSGIFSKMDYIFLPCICNQNLAKAMVNYKDNAVVGSSTSQYKFDGTGVKKGDEVSGNYGMLDLNTEYTLDQTDFCLSIGCHTPTANIGRTTSDIGRVYDGVTASTFSINRVSVGTKNYKNINVLGYSYESGNNYGSAVAVINGNAANASFYRDGSVEEIAGVAGTLPELGTTVELKQFYAEVPLDVIMYGKAITSDERNQLAQLINELAASFQINA